MPTREGGLEIHENIEMERRHWLYERVAWAVMALIVLAEVLGVFGTGVLSHATAAASRDGLRVEYNRFWRMGAPTRLRVHLPSGSAEAGEIRVWLDRGYLSDVDVQQVTPQPEHVEVRADRLTYGFRAGDAMATAEIVFLVAPRRWGKLHARAGLEGGEQVDFAQLVFP